MDNNKFEDINMFAKWCKFSYVFHDYIFDLKDRNEFVIFPSNKYKLVISALLIAANKNDIVLSDSYNNFHLNFDDYIVNMFFNSLIKPENMDLIDENYSISDFIADLRNSLAHATFTFTSNKNMITIPLKNVKYKSIETSIDAVNDFVLMCLFDKNIITKRNTLTIYKVIPPENFKCINKDYSTFINILKSYKYCSYHLKRMDNSLLEYNEKYYFNSAIEILHRKNLTNEKLRQEIITEMLFEFKKFYDISVSDIDINIRDEDTLKKYYSLFLKTSEMNLPSFFESIIYTMQNDKDSFNQLNVDACIYINYISEKLASSLYRDIFGKLSSSVYDFGLQTLLNNTKNANEENFNKFLKNIPNMQKISEFAMFYIVYIYNYEKFSKDKDGRDLKKFNFEECSDYSKIPSQSFPFEKLDLSEIVPNIEVISTDSGEKTLCCTPIYSNVISKIKKYNDILSDCDKKIKKAKFNMTNVIKKIECDAEITKNQQVAIEKINEMLDELNEKKNYIKNKIDYLQLLLNNIPGENISNYDIISHLRNSIAHGRYYIDYLNSDIDDPDFKFEIYDVDKNDKITFKASLNRKSFESLFNKNNIKVLEDYINKEKEDTKSSNTLNHNKSQSFVKRFIKKPFKNCLTKIIND